MTPHDAPTLSPIQLTCCTWLLQSAPIVTNFAQRFQSIRRFALAIRKPQSYRSLYRYGTYKELITYE